MTVLSLSPIEADAIEADAREAGGMDENVGTTFMGGWLVVLSPTMGEEIISSPSLESEPFESMTLFIRVTRNPSRPEKISKSRWSFRTKTTNSPFPRISVSLRGVKLYVRQTGVIAECTDCARRFSACCRAGSHHSIEEIIEGWWMKQVALVRYE